LTKRIDNCFKTLKLKNKKALITFLTAGDPNYDLSLELIKSLPEAGADIIEIGMPFSDPMADGPAIQASSLRAINAGHKMEKTFEIIESFRKNNSHTPIILMGYFNPIYQFGLKKFFSNCKNLGVDGLIIVDLPPEEDYLIQNLTIKNNIHNIRLIAPTTELNRVKKIAASSKGFLYYVSVMGITGTKKPSIESVKRSVISIKKYTNLPILVGFGINSYSQIKKLNQFSEGCVVGSAIIKIIEGSKKKEMTNQKILTNISEFLIKLKKNDILEL